MKRASALAVEGSQWYQQLEKLVAQQAELGISHRLEQSSLFQQFTQVMRLLSRERPLVLVIDDLQWADDASINLLFHLGRQIEGSRILIVGAYRPTEVALGRSSLLLYPDYSPSGLIMQYPYAESSSNGELSRHPLLPVAQEFKRNFGDIEVNLEQAESGKFVDALVDSEPNRLGKSFRQTLYLHTRGIPLFTVELLRGMQERQDLVKDEQGNWVEGRSLNWEKVPERVEAAIAQRINRLPERLQAILKVACVESETFTAEVIAQVLEVKSGDVVHSLSDLLDRKNRLVRAVGVTRLGGQRLSLYRFRHILFQKYLYNRLDLVERVHLHQRVGLSSEALYADGLEEKCVQLARHFQKAGITEKAVEYLICAGDRAKKLYANAEAKRYYKRALDLLSKEEQADLPIVDPELIIATLLENLGEVHWLISEYDRASHALEEALLRVPEGNLIWKARILRKMGNLWRIQRQYSEALQYYGRAENELGAVPDSNPVLWWREWLDIYINRIWTNYWLARWRDMAALVEKVEPVILEYGTLSHRIDLQSAKGTMIYRRDGYIVTEEMVSLFQTAFELSQDLGDIATIASCQFELGFALLWHGDYQDAENELLSGLRLSERTGDVVLQTRSLTYLTILSRIKGNMQETLDFASRSLTLAEELGMVEYIGAAQANMGWLAWRESRLDTAEEKEREAFELWSQIPLVYPFRWLALWPLIGVNLEKQRIHEACDFAKALLDEAQMRLPEELALVIKAALAARERSDMAGTMNCLDRSLVLAQEFGFL